MSAIEALHALGQSLWLDDLRREWLESGELKRRIDAGQIRGMTSNPTIFEQAIAKSEVYSASIRPLAQAGWPTRQILDAVMFDDIRAAADLFRPIYESTSGGDGYVSLEVSPALADDTEATVLEARRLWSALNRPNVMIKIPATRAGVPAVRRAIADGINVNITLIFSLTRYAEVIEAYLAGLEERAERGAPLNHIASVASFFVSRVDTLVDARLEAILRAERPEAERAAALRGKAAIANAKLAYAHFQAAFGAERFEALRARGARRQRPLWASTSTKNPAYPDTYYVDSLIGSDTVNTLPPATLDAFADHGRAEAALHEGLSDARSRLEALESLGLRMAEVTDELERQGVAKFVESFESLEKTVERRANAAAREIEPIRARLRGTLETLDRDEVGRRLWSGDGSLWPGDPSAWLGWLELPRAGLGALPRIQEFAHAVRQEFRHTVLLGMGGSSLAAEVLRNWAVGEDRIGLTVLDTIEPGAVRKSERGALPRMHVASSKSGTTVEVRTLLDIFWAKAGEESARGKGFAAITDRGTPLEALARERGFREIFLAPEDVGGRFSALSAFGLIPAALAGVDVAPLLEGGAAMARACGPTFEAARNPGLFLGAVLASAWEDGRDKVSLLADAAAAPILPWIEQLMAESSGKAGKGLWPIIGESPATASHYGPDRLIVYLRTDGSLDGRVGRWVGSGIPVAVIEVGAGVRGIGAEFYRWEVATAVACHRLGVNAFDQPDVQAAKDAARAALTSLRAAQTTAPAPESWHLEGAAGRERSGPGSMVEAFEEILGRVRPRDVFAILSFLPEAAQTGRAVERLRRSIREGLGNATIFGLGPRYLHSTGQLLKGGPDGVVALYLYAPTRDDVKVPEAGHTLGDLLRAQARGDFEAMQAKGRRAYFLRLDRPVRMAEVVKAFEEAIANIASRGSSTGG